MQSRFLIRYSNRRNGNIYKWEKYTSCLENLEKLKVRQLELEYNKFIKNLDSIPVEQISDVRANYLKAVGKTEDTLGFFDKRILKLLEGKLSVLKDRFI